MYTGAVSGSMNDVKSLNHYFLLGDAYKQNDVIVNKITNDEQWESCGVACDNCRICKSTSPFGMQCWRHCDRCRYCKFRGHHTAQTRDPPYFNRHPDLPDPNYINFAASKFTTGGVCGPVLYADYIRQYNDYVHCKQCQLRGECWSKYQQKCVVCSDEQLAVPCEEKYGCQNPNGPLFGYGPPRDPMFTNCKKCWEKHYTTLM